MFEVWVDPASKRIMAQYVGCSTKSTVWKDLGYEKYNQIEPWMLPKKPAKPVPPTYPDEIGIKGDDGDNYLLEVKSGAIVVKKQSVAVPT